MPKPCREQRRQAQGRPRLLAYFTLHQETVIPLQSSSGLSGNTLNKKSGFSDKMSETGVNSHSPPIAVTPLPTWPQDSATEFWRFLP